MENGKSSVFIEQIDTDNHWHEQEIEEPRNFRESYYRVIELVNLFIERGYRMRKFDGHKIVLYNECTSVDREGKETECKTTVIIGHSNNPAIIVKQ